MMETPPFKLKDVFWGLIVPVLVAIVILLFPTVIKSALDSAFPPPSMESAGSPYAFLTVIFTHGLALMVMFAIPLILGLGRSQWAGGMAGFLMGSLYYVSFAGYNVMYSMINYGIAATPNLFADPSFIGDYILGGILIGYIAGALNKRSYSFKRMLGAALTAAITVGVMQFALNMTVSFTAWMAQADWFTAFYQALLPMVILGIITPIIAKISYGSEILPMT